MMKLLNGKKSPLLAGGLLLISLYLLYHSQSVSVSAARQHDAVKITPSQPGVVRHNEDYLKTALGELFPVLKNLNLL